MDRNVEESMDAKYTVSYRRVRYPRLEFKTGTLQLILPVGYKKEKELVEKHEKWISHKQQTIQTALKQSKTRQLDKTRTEQELKTLIIDFVKQYQDELTTGINEIIFRKMKTKWASYSQNNNLTMNTLLKYLPENLIAYVTYHEMIHAKQGRKHDKSFWKLLKRKFENYKSIEENLLVYWFLIQKTVVQNNG
jgi:hypothetical protein